MKIKIDCPHCDDGMAPDGNLCGWCHGFGKLIEATRVCVVCLPGEAGCLCCGGTHRRTVVYPAKSRAELDLLPSENLKELKS